jgi:branched-chain amino acid transport system substrate-binding protein
MTPSITAATRTAILTFALAIAIAACSSDDTDGSDPESTEPTSPPASDTADGDEAEDADDAESDGPTAASVLGGPNPASGDPVVLGFGAGFGAEGQATGAEALFEGAEVAVRYVNEFRGGLAGRPIELFRCDMGALPETAIDCANQFVEEGVNAVLVPVASNGGSVVPIVTGAGIPYVSFAATSVEELGTEGAFSIAGGGLSALGSIALDAEARGYDTVSHVLIDVPQITTVGTLVGDPLFEAAGVRQEMILAPLGVPDLTAQLSTATGDAILVSGDGTTCASALQAYRTLGLDTPLYVQTTCVTDDIAEALPGIYDGMWVATSLANSPEESELFAAMVDRYDPDNPVARTPVEAGVFATGVSTVVSLTGALEGIAEPSSDAIAAGLEAAGAQPVFLGEPANFDCGEPILDLASSLCSVQGHVVRLDADGNVTETGFFDSTELFEIALAG